MQTKDAIHSRSLLVVGHESARYSPEVVAGCAARVATTFRLQPSPRPQAGDAPRALESRHVDPHQSVGGFVRTFKAPVMCQVAAPRSASRSPTTVRSVPTAGFDRGKRRPRLSEPVARLVIAACAILIAISALSGSFFLYQSYQLARWKACADNVSAFDEYFGVCGARP